MRRDLAASVLAAALLGAACADSPASEEVRWTHGSVELVGRLTLPEGAGPHPAAVFLHGVGEGTRDDAIYRAHGAWLAEHGVALLTYDKRGCGESGGDLAEATFADRAGDALAGVELLRADPRIRADAIGLFGSSQGASVALLAASLDPEVAFVATLSPSPASPATQEAVWVDARLREAGFDGAAIRDATAVVRELAELISAGAEHGLLRERLARVEGAAWFETAEIPLPTPAEARRLRALPHDFEPLEALERIRVPVFAAQGAEDELVPGPWGALIYGSVPRPGGAEIQVELIDGAGHILRDETGAWHRDYWDALRSWLRLVLPG